MRDAARPATMAETTRARPAAMAEATRARRLAAGFSLLLALTFGLIVLGALVRAHGAGLACPDWPLCFGQWIPRFDFGVAFEWGHRALAGSVSLAFVALSAATLRSPPLRGRVGGLLALAAGLLALQVVLGGLTVLELLASWTVTSHLVTGNAFAATLLLVVLQLREAASPVSRPALGPAPRAAIALVAGMLLLQVVLGGLVSSRYAGLACPDWPACRDGIWFPSFAGALGLQLSHRLTAYALLLALGAAAWLARAHARLARPTALVLALGLAQAVVGISNVLLRIPVEVTGLHSALACALVLCLTYCVREAWLAPLPEPRTVAPARPHRSQGHAAR